MFCPFCGKNIKDDSKYCRHCGNKFSQGVYGVTTSEKTDPLKTESNKKHSINIIRSQIMSTSKLLIGIVLIATIGYLYYHIFVDTLRFSDLVGTTDNFMEAFVINIIDFDTNLTRWDIYRLKNKTIEWKKKENQINSILDPYRRRMEREKFMAEMQQDPSFRKIAQRVYGMGANGLKSTLDAIGNFSLLGIF